MKTILFVVVVLLAVVLAAGVMSDGLSAYAGVKQTQADAQRFEAQAELAEAEAARELALAQAAQAQALKSLSEAQAAQSLGIVWLASLVAVWGLLLALGGVVVAVVALRRAYGRSGVVMLSPAYREQLPAQPGAYMLPVGMRAQLSRPVRVASYEEVYRG